MLRVPRAVLVAATFFAVGCSIGGPKLSSTSWTSGAAGKARVEVRTIDHDLMDLIVWNDGMEPLTVDRDGFGLLTAHAVRARLPDRLARTYLVAPGGTQGVKLRFDWSGIERGESVQLQLDRALAVRGAPIVLAPVTMRAL